ncbi:MAG: SgcJ/EcaC family oxidoreductase [Chloroflexota bacterium]|nr:SgcJ/EcaC family oxidoreductase [Chloroflexota bacterium]
MPARTPDEVVVQIIEALNAADVEAALALYEPNATFVPEPGKAVTGGEAIREVLNGFLALKPRLTVNVTQSVESGDLALVCSRWTLTGTDPGGSPVELAGLGADIVRRQENGLWRFVVDNPFAGAGD